MEIKITARGWDLRFFDKCKKYVGISAFVSIILMCAVSSIRKEVDVIVFSSMCCCIFLVVLYVILYFVDFLLAACGLSVCFNFLENKLDVDTKNESISILYSHFQKVFVDNKLILKFLTGSDRVVSVVPLKFYTKDSVDKILKQFLRLGKEVCVSRQLYGIYSTDFKITYVIDINDNIIKRRKFSNAASLFGVMFYIRLVYHSKDSMWCLFFVLMAVSTIYAYIFYCTIKLVLKKDCFIFKPLKSVDEQMMLWSDVSTAVLAFDKNLILYNRDGDQDLALDLRPFSHDDIQMFLNILSEKAHVEVEPELQKSEEFLIYNQNVQSVTTPSRRRVVSGEKSNPKQNVDKEENDSRKRNLELDDTVQPPETHKRNLEL